MVGNGRAVTLEKWLAVLGRPNQVIVQVPVGHGLLSSENGVDGCSPGNELAGLRQQSPFRAEHASCCLEGMRRIRGHRTDLAPHLNIRTEHSHRIATIVSSAGSTSPA